MVGGLRWLLLLAVLCQVSCTQTYHVKNLAKTDVDLVADEVIDETRALVSELMIKLYRRNPSELRKNPGMTIEGRLAQLRINEGALRFEEHGGREGIEAMNLAFDPAWRGDRVFALIAGLGGMLRQACDYKSEMFFTDSLNSAALATSARNVEVLVWKLKQARLPNGAYFLISHESSAGVDNLSFERLFGKLIALQDLLARVAGDADDRMITSAVHTVSSVFIPLPI